MIYPFNFLRNNKKALRLGEKYKVLRGKGKPLEEDSSASSFFS